MRRLAILLTAVLALASCKGGTKALLPNVSGKAGEVIIVMDKDNWEGNLGVETRNLLACDCPYLAQLEPLYSLVSVAPGGFADLFKVHRNIVVFDIAEDNEEGSVGYLHDVWASPQCVINVKASGEEQAIALLKDNGKTIVSALEQAERDRVIANTIRYEDRNIAPQVEEIFGGSPHFPTGYKLKKKSSDFVWIADEKQYTIQGIFVYRYPSRVAEEFTLDNIISHRNAILKDNVPGMFDGTYMTTSTAISPETEYLRYKGRDFTQTRGYWEVENDYMGGPFVSHSFYSKDGMDIITVEAFVYAPKYDKRQYLRQVESILYSWEWAAEEDKN
ncbi:MAG: DUF4837 family protein [Bacteroidales bacterium]|nr:DUF4837 family protein [Bacteroidales bacterium]